MTNLTFEVVQRHTSNVIPLGDGRAYEVRVTDCTGTTLDEDAAEIIESGLSSADAIELRGKLAHDYDDLRKKLGAFLRGDITTYGVRPVVTHDGESLA